jgi:SAM-dependent methyltransferase
VKNTIVKKLQGPYTKFCETHPRFRKFIRRLMYQGFGILHHDSTWTFMNFGYAPVYEADREAGEERYCASLYRHVAEASDLRGAAVLEVGCGGGAAFVMSKLGPGSVVGLDYAPRNISICRALHALPGLAFVAGDAERLPFPDESFDAVLNIKSSHCYASIDAFLAEVNRVLRPNGRFLFADYRPREAVADLDEAIARAGFSVMRKVDITANIVRSLREDSERRVRMIDHRAPAFLRSLVREFAGVEGSCFLEDFLAERRRYLSWVLGKATCKQGEATAPVRRTVRISP